MTSDSNKLQEKKASERDSKGRFLPGHKYSPGRPVGAANRLLKTIREAAESVALPRIVEAAKGGDLDACRLLIMLGTPKVRPVVEPQRLDIPDGGTRAEKLRALADLVSRGEVSPEVARLVAEVLSMADSAAISEQTAAKIGVLITPGILTDDEWQREAEAEPLPLTEGINHGR